MMINGVGRFFAKHNESERSCLLAVRDLILGHDPLITEALKYGMPFFLYRGKMFCYLWTRKESGQPYLGIVEGQRVFHPLLIQEDRARMKIFLLDPTMHMPVGSISAILDAAIALYTSGEVKIKK
jgi:Domain of unknown function (DU1801)